ncbi:hypothetical protein D3C80_1315440 [compost metagenome]
MRGQQLPEEILKRFVLPVFPAALLQQITPGDPRGLLDNPLSIALSQIPPVHHPDVAQNLLLMLDAHGQTRSEPHLHYRRNADRAGCVLQLVHDALFTESDDNRVRHAFADDCGDARRITLKLMGAVADNMVVTVLYCHLGLQRFADGIRQGFHTVKKTVKSWTCFCQCTHLSLKNPNL